jgi:hypothetical protein
MIVMAIILSGGWHHWLRQDLADLRFAWQTRPASGNMVVVGIDAASIEKIGVWPWPRSLYADLLRQLEKANVQDIALDVDFSTPADAAADLSFAEALENAGGSVVLPSFQQPAVTGLPFISIGRYRNSQNIHGHHSSMSKSVPMASSAGIRSANGSMASLSPRWPRYSRDNTRNGLRPF